MLCRLVPFDNKNYLVDAILFSNFSEKIVFLQSVPEQRIVDILCWLLVVLAHDFLERLAYSFVAAVINPVCIKKEYVHHADIFQSSDKVVSPA